MTTFNTRKDPLIKRWSDDLKDTTPDQRKETAISAQALKIEEALQFGGEMTTIPNNNLNAYITAGIVRIDMSTITSGKPDTPMTTGYLQVYANYSEHEFIKNVGAQITQMFIPDDFDNSIVYRTGVNEDGVAVTWNTWKYVGGSLLRRTLTNNITGLLNTVYASFGNWTLTLPEPVNCPLNSKIILEQYPNDTVVTEGYVKCGSYVQKTVPVYTLNASGLPVVTGEPQIYAFECVATNSGTHIWIMDCDTDEERALDKFHTELNTAITALDTKVDTLMPRKVQYHNDYVTGTGPDYDNVFTTNQDINDPWSLVVYDHVVHVDKEINARCFQHDTPVDWPTEVAAALPDAAKIPLGLHPIVKFEIYCDENDPQYLSTHISAEKISGGVTSYITEKFFAPVGSCLLVMFTIVLNEYGANEWRVVE